MKLNEEHLKAVAAWFAGGASLDEIQKRLTSEFGVHVTYFDLRMIVADLPQPEPEESETAAESGEPSSSSEASDSSEIADSGEASESSDSSASSEASEGGPQAANVSVTVDAIMIPGTMASGEVVFSDGVKGKWYLDQMGRLGLGGDLPQGYRPAPEDAALFQARLMEALRSKGLC